MGLLNAVQVSASPAYLNASAAFTARQQIIATVPTTANYGLLSLGPTAQAFDGSTSGFFVSSASGTYLAVNAPSGYAGYHLHFQTAGITNFVVFQSGVVGIGTRSISGNGPFGDTALLIFDGGTPFLALSTQYGIDVEPTFSSAATGAVYDLFARVRTAAAAYTVTSAYGMYVGVPTKGAGSAITTAYGIYVDAQSQAATNNYGLYVATPSGGATINYGAYFAGGTPAIYVNAGGVTVNAGGIAVTGASSVTAGLTTLRLDTGSGVSNVLSLQNLGANNAANGISTTYRLNNSTPATFTYAQVIVTSTTPTAGAEVATYDIQTAVAGGVLSRLLIGTTGRVTIANGLTVTASGLTVTAGGETITAGNFGVGVAVAVDTGIRVNGATLATSTSQYGVRVDPTYSSAATTAGYGLYSLVTTAAVAFTMTNAYGVYVDTPVIGAGSAITNVYGTYWAAQSGGGTLNYVWYAATTTNASSLTQAGLLTVGNGLTVSAGVFVASATEGHTFGGSTSAARQLWIQGSAASGTTVSLDIGSTLTPGVNAQSWHQRIAATFNKAASGTHALFAGLNLAAPAVAAGAATLTETATLYIAGAVSANAGATNNAIHVAGGTTLLDGALTVTTGGFFLNSTNTNNQFNTASTGAGTTTMYIGNASINVTSDVRLKRDITPTSINALDVFRRLEVVDYTWDDPSDTAPVNRNSRGRWTGITAQDAIDVVPYLVNAPDRMCPDCRAGRICHKHEGNWNVDWSQEFGLVTKGFQEVDARIAHLECELASLQRATTQT